MRPWFLQRLEGGIEHTHHGQPIAAVADWRAFFEYAYKAAASIVLMRRTPAELTNGSFLILI
jgi:hypothetical protein